MRNRTRLFLFLAFLIHTVALAGAQGLTVAYLEGKVEQMSGSTWIALQIGDRVAASDSLRLAANAYVEIAAPNGQIKMSKAGTYLLSDVVKGSDSMQKANIASLVAGRMQKLTQKVAGDRAGTVGGVRAAKAGEEKLSWAGDENAQELIERGIKELASAGYARALDTFEEARAMAEPDSARKVDFYIGYTQYLGGDGRRALKTLKSVSSRPADDFYGLYVVTLSGLYLETNAAADALGLLNSWKGPDRETDQSVAFLKGLALRQSGNQAEARKQLVTARDLDPVSDTGKAAAAVLAEMRN